MPAKSQSLTNALLNQVLRNVAYTPATTVYVALFVVAPSSTTGGTEVADTNYARQAVSFSAAVAGSTSNTAPLNFFGAGAAGSVGAVVAIGVMDAAVNGNILYFGTLAAPKAIGAGDTMSFAATALSVSEA